MAQPQGFVQFEPVETPAHALQQSLFKDEPVFVEAKPHFLTNSGLDGGEKIFKGKSILSKKSHGFSGEISLHSSGIQYPDE